MKIESLEYFVALAEEQHFGKAARRCGIAQPTLTVAIQRIENHFGCLLFERKPYAHAGNAHFEVNSLVASRTFLVGALHTASVCAKLGKELNAARP